MLKNLLNLLHILRVKNIFYVLRFLSLKIKILIKIFSVFSTFGLFDSLVGFAKEEPKSLEQKISPQQQKERELKTIKLNF